MIGVITELAIAFALFMAGRFVLAIGGRAVRSMRRLYDRSRNRQSYRSGRQVQGVRVHEEGNAL